LQPHPAIPRPVVRIVRRCKTRRGTWAVIRFEDGDLGYVPVELLHTPDRLSAVTDPRRRKRPGGRA